MQNIQNPQIKLARDFIQLTATHIFLTGKAGTGKTTFLHDLRKTSAKRMLVVAPTGVAAINAGGVTIHSFFQLAFGPQIPGYQLIQQDNKASSEQPAYKRFSKEKIKIIRSLDLLVIDEISMVRADLLDGIDASLRRFRSQNLPFGGVQLLMIGDMQQLAPVINDEEWQLLKSHYQTAYFFSSQALQQTSYVSIELKHVYRQSDEAFIEILNKVRESSLDREVVEKLNSRYNPDFKDVPGYIILTTHNARAKAINENKLRQLSQKTHRFTALIEGSFPEFTYPTDFELSIKKNAQVMFVKNDPSPEKLFYNGKIGTVIKIDDDSVVVDCEGDDEPIHVDAVEWQKMKYSLHPDTNEIQETVEGSFTQMPLKLAWAITIHKSQGLTFEKAIIDAEAAFAHGQVYVALSRCKTLEGMILSSKLNPYAIKSDSNLNRFSRSIEENPPDEKLLEKARIKYQHQLLFDLFDFSQLLKLSWQLIRMGNENTSSLQQILLSDLREINQIIKNEISTIATRFHSQLSQLFNQEIDVEQHPQLQQRVTKAAAYFVERIETAVLTKIEELPIETDNKAVRKAISEGLQKLSFEAHYKHSCLHACLKGFKLSNYVKARTAASLQDIKPKATKGKKKTSLEVGDTALYNLLKDWRDMKADELGVQVYRVITLDSMREISSRQPATPDDLSRIKGLGKVKLKQFGSELLEILLNYYEENRIKPAVFAKDIKKPKKTKPNTKLLTLQMWQAGKSIADIAHHRQLAPTTIEGHLAYHISKGNLDVAELVEKGKIKLVKAFLKKNPGASISATKAAFGKDISYGELRCIIAQLERK